MPEAPAGSLWWQVGARVLAGVRAAFDEPAGQGPPSDEVLDTAEYVLAELEPLFCGRGFPRTQLELRLQPRPRSGAELGPSLRAVRAV